VELYRPRLFENVGSIPGSSNGCELFNYHLVSAAHDAYNYGYVNLGFSQNHDIFVTFESGSILEAIAKCAFRCCKSLPAICIPSSVKVISGQCFAQCEQLVQCAFEADSQIATIEEWMFYDCQKLKTVRLPRSIQSLGTKWFAIVYGYVTPQESCFDTVRFESAQSLQTLIARGMVELPSPFEIEVENWDDETEIPGYLAEHIEVPNIIRLRKKPEDDI
jgi:hypothetical protein